MLPSRGGWKRGSCGGGAALRARDAAGWCTRAARCSLVSERGEQRAEWDVASLIKGFSALSLLSSFKIALGLRGLQLISSGVPNRKPGSWRLR